MRTAIRVADPPLPTAFRSTQATLPRDLLDSRTIDDSRATQIQTALSGAGYLQGEPTGHWDTSTQAAMQRFQADHGWQTKLIPDSRAIIKLGLGPGASPATTSSASSLNDKAETTFPSSF